LILSVRGLVVGFPAPVVRGLDFDVEANEVLCIVGESGSGKSVTALALCGLLPPEAIAGGSVRLGGTEVIGADDATLRRMRGEDVGFIFQDPATTFNPVLPIGQQVVEAPLAHGRLPRRDAAAKAVALLREVEIADPATRAGQYPHQFSGGMRQRAVIAMAMAGRPRLIIADEPTTALDVTVQAQVLELLARRRRELGAAVILITHDLGVVAEIADRVLVMYGGRGVELGRVTDIFARPRHPYTRALLRSTPRLGNVAGRLDVISGQPPSPGSLPSGCAFHPRCAIGHERERCRHEDPALRPLDQQFVACHFPEETTAGSPGVARADRAIGPAVLEVDRLGVSFPLRTGLLRRQTGAVRAVDGLSLVLHAGETLGLVGESGCGKTTSGRAILGLVRPSAGRVIVEGQDITDLSRRALRPVRRHIQYVFQDPFASLNPALTVGEAIAEPMRIHGVFEARRVAELLERVGLPATAAGRFPREFSGGQKQRISIARALALQPRVLILDEPVASLDVSIQAQVVNLLRDLQQAFGLAYMFISHDLSVVRHISDRVAVMYLGRVVEEGPAEAIYREPMHPYTQALLSAVPSPDPTRRRGRIILGGEVPNPASPPPGCSFHPRCVRATSLCRTVVPVAEPAGATRVACHHPGPAPALIAA
jgi:peptide/nickel transport system ATP-binding protein